MEASAKHDFNATADDELSFHKNDVIKVLDMEEDRNWFKAEKDGREGFIPANYIKMKTNAWYHGKIKRANCELVLLKKAGGSYIQPDGAFIVRLSESTPGDFSLSVKWGESVQHFKILRDGAGRYFLWIVKFNSINELLEYHRTSSVSRSQTIYLKDMVGESPAERVQALYNFEAEEEGELSFTKGTVLTVLDKPDPNWWMGMDTNGSRGLIPSTYVKAI